MGQPSVQTRSRVAAVLTSTIAAPWDRWDGPRRDRLAVTLYAYQYQQLAALRVLSAWAGKTPDEARGWRDLPLVPVQANRTVALFCGGDAVREFRTAGTTGTTTGVVRLTVEGCTLAVTATVAEAATFLVEPGRRQRVLGLTPAPQFVPTLSPVMALDRVLKELGAPGSRFLGSDAGVDRGELVEELRSSESAGPPLVLVGYAPELIETLDGLAAGRVRVRLPEGSRVAVIGVAPARLGGNAGLVRAAEAVLGVREADVVDIYFLTEMATPLFDRGGAEGGGRVKVLPPWVRAVAVDPETLTPLGPGEVGLLGFVDLASLDRPASILTDDLGFVVPDGGDPEGGVVILRRAEAAELGMAWARTEQLVAELRRR